MKRKGGFITFMATTFIIAIVVTVCAGMLIDTYICTGEIQRTQHIETASLGSEVEGSFAVFGGTINENQYYFYYTEQGEGLELDKQLAETTTIIEKNDVTPRVEWYNCRNDKLYVPNGTVVKDYNVAQPGLR